MFSILGRIGRDVELRYTQNGDAVAGISIAYNYGRKGQDGNKPSQWLDAALWGKQAEALQPYLTKGKLIAVSIDDLHVEEYPKKDGSTGSKLTGRIVKIDFAGGGDRQEQRQAPQQAPQQTQGDFVDDDVPF